jgi:hypothetical protein
MAYGWSGLPFSAVRSDGLGLANRPSAPLSLDATAASDTEIDLTWAAPASGTTSGYKVERGTNGVDFVQVGTSATPDYSDTGLVADTTYHYRVLAYNAAENGSAYSASNSATTDADPGSSDIPDATNTGLFVELGGSLPSLTAHAGGTISSGTFDARQFNGAVTVNGSGVTFTRCLFTGGLDIASGGNNCTVQNSKFTGTAFNGAIRSWSATGLLVENCEFDGSAAPDALDGKGISGGNMIVRRCNIHHTASDGIQVNRDNTLIEWNYIHHVSYGGYNSGNDVTPPTIDHADGIQLTTLDVANHTTGHVWRFNHIHLPGSEYGGTPWGALNSCITMQNTNVSSLSIEGNWLYGGGYTIRLEAGGTMTGEVIDNKIGPHEDDPVYGKDGSASDVYHGSYNKDVAGSITTTNNRYTYGTTGGVDSTSDGSLAFGS